MVVTEYMLGSMSGIEPSTIDMMKQTSTLCDGIQAVQFVQRQVTSLHTFFRYYRSTDYITIYVPAIRRIWAQSNDFIGNNPHRPAVLMLTKAIGAIHR